MTYGPSVGRILLGLLFFGSGLAMAFLQGPAGVADYFTSLSIPLAGAAAYAVIAVKIVAGGALMFGEHSRTAAMVLICFTFIATLIAHLDISDPNLLKNLAIIGGLLYVIGHGPGDHWTLRSRTR